MMEEFPPLEQNAHKISSLCLGLEWPGVCLLDICITMKSWNLNNIAHIWREREEKKEKVQREKKRGGVHSKWKMKSDLCAQNTDFPMRWKTPWIYVVGNMRSMCSRTEHFHNTPLLSESDHENMSSVSATWQWGQLHWLVQYLLYIAPCV